MCGVLGACRCVCSLVTVAYVWGWLKPHGVPVAPEARERCYARHPLGNEVGEPDFEVLVRERGYLSDGRDGVRLVATRWTEGAGW